MTILQLENITVRYGSTTALDHITASIPCGASTAIIGPNGAGKSTLLRAIAGLQPIQHGGQIHIGDQHPGHLRPRLAYLPQRQTIDWNFPITVREVVAQGRYPHKKFWRPLDQTDQAAIDRALAELDITHLASRPIHQLSGGQQQRTFLARAIAQGADIFLLDEPFAALDIHAATELTHTLRQWTAQGRTILAALHDLHLARAHFDQILLLNTTLKTLAPPALALTPENITATFAPTSPCPHSHPYALGTP